MDLLRVFGDCCSSYMHPQKGSLVRWGGSCLYAINVSEVCTAEVLWECMIHHTFVSFLFLLFCKIVCHQYVESLFFNVMDTLYIFSFT